MRAMKNASAAALVGIWMILLTAFVVTIVGRDCSLGIVRDWERGKVRSQLNWSGSVVDRL